MRKLLASVYNALDLETTRGRLYIAALVAAGNGVMLASALWLVRSCAGRDMITCAWPF